MKKMLWVLGLALTLAGCAGAPPDSVAPTATIEPVIQAEPQSAAEPAAPAAQAAEEPEVVNIREKLFIAQINNIYLNADEYMGKAIRYQGVFDASTYGDENLPFYSVIRYGPGCCGDDGNVGFEVIWERPYPKQGAWVEVTGMLERYEEYGSIYLRLRLSELKELSTRGNAYVSQ